MHHKQDEAEDGKRDADRVNEIEDCAAFFLLGPAGCPLVGRKAMFFLDLSRHDADARRAKVRVRHRAAAVQGDLAGIMSPIRPTRHPASPYGRIRPKPAPGRRQVPGRWQSILGDLVARWAWASSTGMPQTGPVPGIDGGLPRYVGQQAGCLSLKSARGARLSGAAVAMAVPIDLYAFEDNDLVGPRWGISDHSPLALP